MSFYVLLCFYLWLGQSISKRFLSVPAAWFAHPASKSVYLGNQLCHQSTPSCFAAPSPGNCTGPTTTPHQRGAGKLGWISATPNQGENSWLAQQMPTSRLPSQLETPIDFSEAGMVVGERGGGRRKPQQRKAWKYQSLTPALRG